MKGVDRDANAEVVDITTAPRKKQHPDHLDNRFRKRDGTAAYTGCRQTRGQGGFGYVHDPLGIDYPPTDWPHPRPTQEQIRQALRKRDAA